MDAVKQIDVSAMIQLKSARRRLTVQQYRTIKGQILAGDPIGAMQGLRKILLISGSNAIKRHK